MHRGVQCRVVAGADVRLGVEQPVAQREVHRPAGLIETRVGLDRQRVGGEQVRNGSRQAQPGRLAVQPQPAGISRNVGGEPCDAGPGGGQAVDL